MGSVSSVSSRLRLQLLIWLMAAVAVTCCGCRRQSVYVPTVTGTSHTFAAAEVQPLADGVQKRLQGQIACLVDGKPGILVGPAASGMPSYRITDVESENLELLQWRPDGRSLAVSRDYADDVTETPLQNWSCGTLGILDVGTSTITSLDPDRLLDLSAIAASQADQPGVVYAGVFQGKEGLLATEMGAGLDTKVLLPEWSVCPGGVSVSADGTLAARSDQAAISYGDGILTISTIPDGKTLLRRDESMFETPPQHSWRSPAFHPVGRTLAYLQDCQVGNERDAIVLTAVDAGGHVSDCYFLPPGGRVGWELTWSPDGRYLAAPGLDAAEQALVWLLDVKERRLWRWLEGVGRLVWGPEPARDQPNLAPQPSGASAKPRVRGDGLPSGAVWIREGRIATYPKDLKLPSGLREATGLRRLLKPNATTFVWVQESGPMHEGFRVSLGDLKTQKTTVLVSSVDAFELDDPEWALENVALSHDRTRALFRVREAGSGRYTAYYDVALASPAKPHYLEDADVWDSVSRDGTVRVRHGWALPDEGGANCDRYGYIEVLRKGETEPRCLWKLKTVQERSPWAEMINALAVSPDGTRIAYSTSGGLWVVALDQRPAKPSQLGELMPDQSVSHLTWTPEGQHLLASIVPANGDTEGWHETRLIDPATGSSTGMAGHPEGVLFLE
jgi:hypothetical protein